MSEAWNVFADDDEKLARLAVLLEAKVAALGPEDRARIDAAAGMAVTRCRVGEKGWLDFYIDLAGDETGDVIELGELNRAALAKEPPGLS